MRIALIGAESTGLGAALAAHLHLDHIQRPEEITTDGFVLDGAPRDLAEARALDAMLRARAAEVEAVLWLRSDVVSPADTVLDHYRGRVIELEPNGQLFEEALDRLREALSTV